MRPIEHVPIRPTSVRDGALAELERVTQLVGSLSEADWSRPSAVDGWTIGDVVTHLDLFIGLYERFVGKVLVGGGASGNAKAMGRLFDSVVPLAVPVFDRINAAAPKLMARLLAQPRVKRQLVGGARNTRNRLLRVPPDDDSGPAYSEGGQYPVTLYLAVIVHELVDPRLGYRVSHHRCGRTE